MDKKDFINHSPARSFEKISGGLKAGEMGLVTAKKGLGKTSVLVQFGLDALLHDKHIVHVSFDQHSSNVISWYDSIFAEIAKQKNMSASHEVKDAIMKTRIILNFNQETFTLPKVISTIKALNSGGINIALLVIDGLTLDKVSKADIVAVHDFIKAENMSAWFSDTKDKGALNDFCREELQADFAVVTHLEPSNGSIRLHVLKLRDDTNIDATVDLDSKTLLMK